MNVSLTGSKTLRALFSSAVLFAAALPACASSSGSSSTGTAAAYFDSTCNYLSRCSVDYSAQFGGSTVAAGFVLDGLSGVYLDICSDSGRAANGAKLAYEMALPDSVSVDLAAMASTIDAMACGDLPTMTIRPATCRRPAIPLGSAPTRRMPRHSAASRLTGPPMNMDLGLATRSAHCGRTL